jgi:hypothetical protein
MRGPRRSASNYLLFRRDGGGGGDEIRSFLTTPGHIGVELKGNFVFGRICESEAEEGRLLSFFSRRHDKIFNYGFVFANKLEVKNTQTKRKFVRVERRAENIALISAEIRGE